MSKSNNDDKIVAKNLKILRIANRMSQKQMSAIIGVSLQQLQKYESSTNRISAGNLIKVANALKIPMHAFYKKPDDVFLNDVIKDEKAYLKIAKIFVQIPIKAQQDALLALAKTMVPKQNNVVGE